MGKVASFETQPARRVRIKTPTVKPSLRNQQRVAVVTEITLECSDGQCVTCTASNLSRTGMTVCCDQQAVKQLIPNLHPPAPGNWIDVKARFSVPALPDESVTVHTDSHIVHMRRLSRNEFQIGIQFCEFQGNGYDYLDKYVARLLSEGKQA